MFTLSQWPRFSVLGIATLVIGGCSFNGTYPDANEPDAAKLRFISSNEGSTLDLYDAEHCEGRTTGLLNNLLVANTKRRAAMSIPAPENAKAYLEVRLQPGREYVARVNTLSTGSVCTVTFNFTPQGNGEYEADFRYQGNTCQVKLNRLRRIATKVVRAPIALANRGLAACTPGGSVSPKSVVPQSAERTALIAKIVDASVVPRMKPDSPATSIDLDVLADKAVEERKQHLGFSLPSVYWSEYRQNIVRFTNDMTNTKFSSLQTYKDYYSSRLGLLETSEIMQLLLDSETADHDKLAKTNNAMLEYYFRIQEEAIRETLANHQARMADLDQRFEVCQRFEGCWQN
jgi:hypothetical protein